MEETFTVSAVSRAHHASTEEGRFFPQGNTRTSQTYKKKGGRPLGTTNLEMSPGICEYTELSWQ